MTEIVLYSEELDEVITVFFKPKTNELLGMALSNMRDDEVTVYCATDSKLRDREAIWAFGFVDVVDWCYLGEL